MSAVQRQIEQLELMVGRMRVDYPSGQADLPIYVESISGNFQTIR